MQILSLRTLKEFWQQHKEAEAPLRTWHSRVAGADWKGPDDVKVDFGTTADFVADNRIVFDIGGNKYRLIAHVAYRFKRVLIKFVGTHKEYDKVWKTGRTETIGNQK
jgi:mRNA interferase HigB